MTFFTPHLPLREWTFNSCVIFDIEGQDGLKKHDEYSISCEATCCWYGASNQRAVFAFECFSVYGQKSTSPSWILNAYQRWWQARGQKAAQVAAVWCSIRPQRPTEPLTVIPDPALSLQSAAVCLYCHFSSLYPPTDSREWKHNLLLIGHHRLLAQTKSHLFKNQRHIKRAN